MTTNRSPARIFRDRAGIGIHTFKGDTMLSTHKAQIRFAACLSISILIFVMSVVAQTTEKPKTGPASVKDEPAPPGQRIKVTFDEKNSAVIIVESNGERVRVDTASKTIEAVEPATPAVALPSESPGVKQDDERELDPYYYESGDEPFDYRLVNVPTPKKVPKGTWNLTFTHRFSQPLHPLSESGSGLLGFDSMSTSSFGVSYGITDRFYVSAYRSPLCQRGLCRVIEVGVGYHFTDQDKKWPVALNAYASVEGNDNFTEEYTYNLQMMMSRRFGKRLFLYFSPAVHLNSNGQRRFNPRPDEYFPPATVADSFLLPAHTASFAMGASFRITPSLMGIFEFTPRTGFKLGRVDPIFDTDFNVTGFRSVSRPEMGIGFQYTVGKHMFTLTFSNTQTTTTSRYNSSNLVLAPRRLIIGFNIFRRW